MAGNTVMVKHAANVPQCAEAIAQLFSDCGLPSDFYTNLFIPTDFVEDIISDTRVQGVSLTGSEQAGAAVASLAGKHLKRSVLELGGNDPFIVLEDADAEEVAKLAVKGRMGKMKMGDSMDEGTTLSPLSTEDAAVKLQAQVQQAIDAGATVLLGGDRPDREGAYFNPTILTDVEPGTPTFDQELFGPVASIYVVKDEAEAIKLANNSSYGLGGSVFTSDIERGQRVAKPIESGMVFLNQPTKSQAELPFGGIKNSGYGRELSHLGIMEFVNKKLIHCGKQTPGP